MPSFNFAPPAGPSRINFAKPNLGVTLTSAPFRPAAQVVGSPQNDINLAKAAIPLAPPPVAPAAAPVAPAASGNWGWSNMSGLVGDKLAHDRAMGLLDPNFGRRNNPNYTTSGPTSGGGKLW
jgi:hypothetical protein